ncbi:MAG: TolC family protein [Bryobacterales bacterium]|nr:TolC family protein [Bryobacterales bacterium]
MNKSWTLALVALPLTAQSPLSLKDAVRMALEKHPAVEASRAGEQAAGTRIRQARSGYLPKLNYSESWQRSNNPVFVFSSLLTQHQFTEQNFRIDTLNRPDALNNFQSQLIVDQVLYDAGQTGKAVKAANLAHGIASESKRRTDLDVIMNTTRAYYGAVLASENVKVAQESVKSAEADLQRAEAVRAAGMATDADVLSIRVHLAGMREQAIRAANDLEVARAALNEALGLPLDTRFDLSTPLAPAAPPAQEAAGFEKEAVEQRPEARQAELAEDLARTQLDTARSSLLPQVFFRGAFEADRQRFINRGGANWAAGVSLRWNLFNGFADKARIDEALLLERRAQAEKQRAENGIRLQVRKARLDLQSAGERIEVTRAAVAQAEESHRIIQNRYQNGLTTVTELLRSEAALLAARTRHLAAIHDQKIASAALLEAAGTLNKDSEL